MKRGLGCVAGKLHYDISNSQRRNIASYRHPDQSSHIHQRSKQDVWAAAPPRSDSAPHPITEHAKKWIGEERDKSARHQHERQRGPFTLITYNLENLAWKDDNTKSSPMKIEREVEYADRKNLRPSQPGKSDRRAMRGNHSLASLPNNSHFVAFFSHKLPPGASCYYI